MMYFNQNKTDIHNTLMYFNQNKTGIDFLYPIIILELIQYEVIDSNCRSFRVGFCLDYRHIG